MSMKVKCNYYRIISARPVSLKMYVKQQIIYWYGNTCTIAIHIIFWDVLIDYMTKPLQPFLL